MSFSLTNAQSSWKKMSSKNTSVNNKYALNESMPNKYNLYSLDDVSFKSSLISNKTIYLPNNNGDFSEFSIKKASNFTNEVSDKYGDISAYTIKGIDDKTASGKISIGTDGVHVMILSAKHATMYIDPYTQDKSSYIAYNKNDLNSNENFTCLVDDDTNQLLGKSTIQLNQKITNDGLFRTYRLALACTGEYAQFHINRAGLSDIASDSAKEAAVLSAMNTTMTRVNGIFEREFAVTMEIILNNNGENDLIFLDADADNLSNNNASALIDESTDICNAIIGSANYDIGHTFSTGAGGLAYLGSVCVDSVKGGGVTGSSFPVGDSYDIDFVAHELGHQFGANHTFNSSSNGCEGNRSNSTAAEPGSGSTIMAYAGLCSPHNIQNNSDDYFHAISTTQILNTIQSTSCAATSSSGNTAPTVNAGSDVSVPKSTPLVLQGTASDINGDALTYCWEQIDVEIASMPPISTNTAGPAFRSLPPSESPNRYLPTLSTVINGSTENDWEVIPSVARSMNFAFNVRDNNTNGGAISRDDINISVIDTDPFVITSQNTSGTIWKAGSTETITWDKSTTDIAPINCENVKIMLSTNGGESFDITLVESTPNDGSYDVIVPNNVTTSARIMVLAVDNIFYNVNAINFEIESSEPNFIISNSSDAQSTCMNSSSVVEYTFSIEFINGFNETISLNTQNLPAGVISNFSSNNITSNTNITLTLENFENTAVNDYSIEVLATSTSINNTLELPVLSVQNSDLGTTVLSSPANNSNDIPVQNTTLSWDTSNSSATSYSIEIATDASFSNIVISEENLMNNSYLISQILDWDTQYFWRIKPSNSCSDGDFTSSFSFTTDNENYCTSTFDNYFDEFISNVTFNDINNDSGLDNDDGYEDFTNISTQLLLGETYTLSVSFDPVGFQDHCYVFIDWNGDSIFNTTDERYDLGSHFTDPVTTTQNITIPSNTSLGEKRMRVIIEYFDNDNPFGTGACDSDHNSQEFGETEDYTLIVVDEILNINTDAVFNNFKLYPNPLETGDKLVLAFDKEYPDEKVSIDLFDFNSKLIKRFESNSISTTFSADGKIDLSDVASGLYILTITNGDKTTSKKLIIE